MRLFLAFSFLFVAIIKAAVAVVVIVVIVVVVKQSCYLSLCATKINSYFWIIIVIVGVFAMKLLGSYLDIDLNAYERMSEKVNESTSQQACEPNKL